MPSVADLFTITESDSVWDAWLVVSNLLDMAEKSSPAGYDFAHVRSQVAQVNKAAEDHFIDRKAMCSCGLSDAEHSLLQRKIMKFYQLQVENLKHLLK